MDVDLDGYCTALADGALLATPPNQRLWTPEQDDLLARLHGHLTDAQIGEILGRSEIAVHLRWSRDLHLPPPTSDPAYITGYRIATALGCDNHKPPMWIDRGLLPGEYIPRRDNQLHRRVLRTVFLEWLKDPQNWVWFDVTRIVDPECKRIVQESQAAWGDEWWKTPQVAAYHGVDVGDVKRYIKLGRIKARRVDNIGGRDTATWAYWFVLRSEATRPDLHFVKKFYRKRRSK